MEEKQYINVVGYSNASENTFQERKWSSNTDVHSVITNKSINTDTLRAGMQSFSEGMLQVLDGIDTVAEKYELDSIELSAIVSINGQLSLLGVAETEIGSSNGIKFVFKKRKD